LLTSFFRAYSGKCLISLNDLETDIPYVSLILPCSGGGVAAPPFKLKTSLITV